MWEGTQQYSNEKCKLNWFTCQESKMSELRFQLKKVEREYENKLKVWVIRDRSRHLLSNRKKINWLVKLINLTRFFLTSPIK